MFGTKFGLKFPVRLHWYEWPGVSSELKLGEEIHGKVFGCTLLEKMNIFRSSLMTVEL